MRYDERIAARMRGLDVLVGVSGGKDSIVTLDLARKYAASVRGFFMYCVPGLGFQNRYLDYLSRRYEIEIDRVPHPIRSRWLRQGTYRLAPDRQAPILSFADVYEQLRAETGSEWIVAGEKKRDSLQRRGMLTKSGGFDEKRLWICPLSDWSNRQVYCYLKERGIPLPPDYRLSLTTSFGGLYHEELSAIKERYPDDWKKILQEHPFLEAIFARQRIKSKRKQAQQASSVRAADDPPAGNQEGSLQPARSRSAREKKTSRVDAEEQAG